MKLSILDQSRIATGSNAAEALQNTVQLAQLADELGFHRFWVSEHHDTKKFAGSSPEILMTHLASQTKRIRVGTGGVMLPHYSAYKVAENFKILETLFPNRIDAGIGRAPGGMPRATYALNNGQYRNVDRFPEQVDELKHYLYDTLPKNHPYGNLKATPLTETKTPVWMLGSSTSSAQLAASKGLPYMFAHFINHEAGDYAASIYRKHFVPSDELAYPEQGVAVFFICAETDEKAEYLAKAADLSLLMQATGMPSNGTPSPEEAMNREYNSYELAAIADNRKRMIVGSPKTAKRKIKELAAKYHAEEVMLVMFMHDYDDKLKAIQLISDECHATGEID
ncbi:LLM class flavin-dependent oxidoreductase [Savagea faecisuis]|uniref:LLM class flavin-dependent oxidoreductase n=1 Tax=Savagea faecisuis TaxID=1274803 RepID=A0ABW3H0V3_9BACL